jgi:hypothetical protein
MDEESEFMKEISIIKLYYNTNLLPPGAIYEMII